MSFFNDDEHLRDHVEHDGAYYYVSSNNTPDRGYETMIFLCDKDYEVVSWFDLYSRLYDSFEEMKEYHKKVCENIEFFINKEEEN